MNNRGDKTLFQILIIIDDFALHSAFTRQSKMLHTLYIRGRHNMVSNIIATQKYNAIYQLFGLMLQSCSVYWLRIIKDLETFIAEVATIIK